MRQIWGDTISRLSSRESLAVSVLIVGDHGHLEQSLWTQALQHGVCNIARHHHFSVLLREHRLPFDLVHLDVPWSSCPGGHKAGVRDVAGDQVFGWARRWGGGRDTKVSDDSSDVRMFISLINQEDDQRAPTWSKLLFVWASCFFPGLCGQFPQRDL